MLSAGQRGNRPEWPLQVLEAMRHHDVAPSLVDVAAEAVAVAVAEVGIAEVGTTGAAAVAAAAVAAAADAMALTFDRQAVPQPVFREFDNGSAVPPDSTDCSGLQSGRRR